MRATLVLPPNREIDFGFGCDCVACVRASERSCVREMIPVWLGLAGQSCGVCRRRRRRRPSGRRPRLKVRASMILTDDL